MASVDDEVCVHCGKELVAHHYRNLRCPGEHLTVYNTRKETMSQEPHDPERWGEFVKELEQIINRYSKENDSNTPDFLLAEYMRDCLHAWNAATKARDKWYGVELRPGGSRMDQEAK